MMKLLPSPAHHNKGATTGYHSETLEMGLARLIETLAVAASFRSDLLPRTVQVDASADSRSPGVSFSTVSQQDDDGDPK